MEEKRIVSNLVDYDTGIVLDTIYEGDSYKKTTKEQKDFLNSYVRIKRAKKYLILDNRIINILNECQLTKGTYQVFWIIAIHLGYYDLSGHIIKKSGINACKPLNASSLQDLCKSVDKSTFGRAIKDLVKHEIIFKEKIGRNVFYLANPYIFCSGVEVPTELAEKFKNTKWAK